jgi:hypothetical protein
MSWADGRFRWLQKGVLVALTMVIVLGASLTSPASAMEATRGGALPQPLPLFPPDNWWNRDISNWPLDSNSSSYISFINNGGTRRLHPDFGGTSGAGFGIYGIPYAVVSGVTNADRKAVDFLYWDASDGVDYQTGAGLPFFPIPSEAASQPYWIEGGDPGNVDLRGSQDRHLLIVDRERNHLYELYNVYFDGARQRWVAGSGAFFDMNSNTRRPETWTSADAAGLAILPGLVRYDEVYDPNINEIRHAFRVTVRATNGYVYPASHRAGSTPGALPMGARLRLKANVDVTQKSSDPNVQKIFRAMQKYGLIIADNGSDMFVTGTYDSRWNNDVLNPAFRALSANDFEVIQLGYNPPATVAAALSSIQVSPATILGGQTGAGVVNLTAPAPAGGAVVSLASANPATAVPTTVTIPALGSSAGFPVNTIQVSSSTVGNIVAGYAGVNKSVTVTVNPAPSPVVAALLIIPARIAVGSTAVATVNLTAPAPAGGMFVAMSSDRPSFATVPASLIVPAGAKTATFSVMANRIPGRSVAINIRARTGAVEKSVRLTIVRH